LGKGGKLAMAVAAGIIRKAGEVAEANNILSNLD